MVPQPIGRKLPCYGSGNLFFYFYFLFFIFICLFSFKISIALGIDATFAVMPTLVMISIGADHPRFVDF